MTRAVHTDTVDELDGFRTALWAYVGKQPGKKAAAEALGITRTDLYRYLKGDTAPRSPRRDEMLKAMLPGRRSAPALVSSALSDKSVTQIRDVMLHLVSLLDLDLAGRRVNETKGG